MLTRDLIVSPAKELSRQSAGAVESSCKKPLLPEVNDTQSIPLLDYMMQSPDISGGEMECTRAGLIRHMQALAAEHGMHCSSFYRTPGLLHASRKLFEGLTKGVPDR